MFRLIHKTTIIIILVLFLAVAVHLVRSETNSQQQENRNDDETTTRDLSWGPFLPWNLDEELSVSGETDHSSNQVDMDPPLPPPPRPAPPAPIANKNAYWASPPIVAWPQQQTGAADNNNEKKELLFNGGYTGSGCEVNSPKPTTTQSSNLVVMEFLAFGDTPYDAKVKKPPYDVGKEYKCVKDIMLPGAMELSDKADFIVHVGDIKKGGRKYKKFCNDEMFQSRHDLFSIIEPDIDIFLVPGDNEWNECKDYEKDPNMNDPAKTMWRKYFANSFPFRDFDRTILPSGEDPTVLFRQSGKPENFFFFYKQAKIAFFGITEPAGDKKYNKINAKWVKEKLDELHLISDIRAVVLFGHSNMDTRVKNELPSEIPTLYVTGNKHKYCSQFLTNHPHILQVTVDAYMSAPLRISIIKDNNDDKKYYFHVEGTPYGCQ